MTIHFAATCQQPVPDWRSGDCVSVVHDLGLHIVMKKVKVMRVLQWSVGAAGVLRGWTLQARGLQGVRIAENEPWALCILSSTSESSFRLFASVLHSSLKLGGGNFTNFHQHPRQY